MDLFSVIIWFFVALFVALVLWLMMLGVLLDMGMDSHFKRDKELFKEKSLQVKQGQESSTPQMRAIDEVLMEERNNSLVMSESQSETMDNICEFRVINNSSSIDELKGYFKSFMSSGVPSSMPCPCCGKIMVRPDRYKKERSDVHSLMTIAELLCLKNCSQTTKREVSVLCKECCEKKKETVSLPIHYVILEKDLYIDYFSDDSRPSGISPLDPDTLKEVIEAEINYRCITKEPREELKAGSIRSEYRGVRNDV